MKEELLCLKPSTKKIILQEMILGETFDDLINRLLQERDKK